MAQAYDEIPDRRAIVRRRTLDAALARLVEDLRQGLQAAQVLIDFTRPEGTLAHLASHTPASTLTNGSIVSIYLDGATIGVYWVRVTSIAAGVNWWLKYTGNGSVTWGRGGSGISSGSIRRVRGN